MPDPTTPIPTPVPTQVQHPNRTAWRTAVQVALAAITLIPYAVTGADIPVEGWLAQLVAVAAGISRVMALPRVAEFIQKHFSWLAPAPAAQTTPGHGAAPGEAPGAASDALRQ